MHLNLEVQYGLLQSPCTKLILHISTDPASTLNTRLRNLVLSYLFVDMSANILTSTLDSDKIPRNLYL